MPRIAQYSCVHTVILSLSLFLSLPLSLPPPPLSLSLSLSLPSSLPCPPLQLSALLRVATLTDHQFIFHHLLRSPPGVGKWGAPYVHLLSPLQTKQLLAAQYQNRGACLCI